MKDSTFGVQPIVHARRAWMQRAFLLCAAVTAGLLMLAYIQVCRESVERGERWRSEQRMPAEARAALPKQAGRS